MLNTSMGNCIHDIGGPFATTTAALGSGLAGSVDFFSGPGTQGQLVEGGGFSVGLGGGGQLTGGGSQTWVSPW